MLLLSLLLLLPPVQIERIATGFRFTEGPAMDRKGDLFFSDVPANRIYRISGDGKAKVFLSNTRGCNGLAFGPDGMLYAAQGSAGRIVRINPTTKSVQVVASGFGRPNDLTVARDGSIYFTDPDFRRKRQESVFLLSKGKKPVQIVKDLRHPNGIALSPDERTLYVLPYGRHELWAYPLISGGVGKGRALVKLAGPGGKPARAGGDGMAVAKDGTLYLTVPDLKGIQVSTVAGRFVQFIAMPEAPTNCELTPDDRILVVTAGKSVYRVRL